MIQDDEETTIELAMTSGENPKALSHACITFENPPSPEALQQIADSATSTFGYPVEIVNPDPQTGLIGIKFDETALGEDHVMETCVFTITMDNAVIEGAISITITTKAGQNIIQTLFALTSE